MLKKTIVSLSLVGVVALALASSGGGNRKKAAKLVTPEFTPIKTSTGFSMRSGISYTGSLITSAQKAKNSINLKALSTFQKGNNIYIVPNTHRITTIKTQKNNLNLLDLRINLYK
ncbi:MAG: hypothetical protein EOO04_10575 [Chitinophagaceae bacterium]|nr:MAG: hypothetical protein EOO04_10575 [Chitinophagaceae bacterium]